MRRIDRRARAPPRDRGRRCATSTRRSAVTTNPIPIKAALNLAGQDVGGLRLPLVEATEEEKAVIRAALERHELLAAV